MKEVELHRMDFLRRGGAAFTYKKVAIAFAVWCAFLAALYGLQIARQFLLRHEIASVKKDIDLLNKQKDKQIELATTLSQRRVDVAGQSDLGQILKTRPRWSELLKVLTSNLPTQVELDQVSVTIGAKEPMFEVVGKARSQRDITGFIMRLESSGSFKRTALVKSAQGTENRAGFSFEINTYPVVRK